MPLLARFQPPAGGHPLAGMPGRKPGMTSEQQKDAERLERHIAREGLSSVMNETKWREAMGILRDLMNYDVQFRVKDVRSETSGNRWDGSFPYHVPRPYKTIEWMDIDVGDRIELVAEAFSAKSIPFHFGGAYIRIQGYTRAGQPPV